MCAVFSGRYITYSRQSASKGWLREPTVWVKKSSPPPKFFCDIFTYGEPVQLKITMTIAQTYFYVHTNFDPFT